VKPLADDSNRRCVGPLGHEHQDQEKEAVMNPEVARAGRRLFQVMVGCGLTLGLGLHSYAAYMNWTIAQGTAPIVRTNGLPYTPTDEQPSSDADEQDEVAQTPVV